jgi:UPF0755 protein
MKRLLISLLITLVLGFGLVYAFLVLLLSNRKPTASESPSYKPDISITIIEGKRREEIAVQLAKAGICSVEDFLNASKGYEGQLFPDTYRFFSDTSAVEVVNTMLSTYQKKVLSRIQPTQNELVLASIIEREAKNNADRPLISGVYTNRIHIGMALQSDPTVQYAKDSAAISSLTPAELLDYKFWTPITQDDYRSYNSPYNTYISNTLPPEPIANPGLNSILAAHSPASHDYLFFLYKNDQLKLSHTLAEHQALQ